MLSNKQFGGTITVDQAVKLKAADILKAKFLVLQGEGYSLTLPSLKDIHHYLVVVNTTRESIRVANKDVPARSSIILSYVGTVWF